MQTAMGKGVESENTGEGWSESVRDITGYYGIIKCGRRILKCGIGGRIREKEKSETMDEEGMTNCRMTKSERISNSEALMSQWR